MAKTGVCAFCGVYGELDREHYIAQRFRKLFPVKQHPTYGQRLSTYDPQLRRYRVHTERRVRSPWGLSVHVGKHCCNGSWMRDLDERVAPFLNRALALGPIDIPGGLARDLAGWAAKVAALHELSITTNRAISDADKRHIKRRLTPPPATSAWLTAIEWSPPTLPRLDQTTFLLSPGAIRGEAVHRKNSHSTTIYFGHVAIILFATSSSVRLDPPPELKNRFIRLWPDPRQAEPSGPSCPS